MQFDAVGANNVYLPLAIEETWTFALNYPFIPDHTGEVRFLIPDYRNTVDLSILRKYPLYPRIQYFIDRMIGGRFEGSNKPDFIDAVTLYTVEESPGEYYTDIDIDLDENFRYIRYVSPADSYCNVAELGFYEKEAPDIPLKGKIIGTDGLNQQFPERTKEKAFDGDVLTFYHAPVADHAWIGMDFGSAKNIGRIRFIPRTDYNIIVEGDVYEVFYWDNQWLSLGTQTATSHVLTYENVPSGCLYFIKNHSSGKEERIFTYEDGKQVWW